MWCLSPDVQTINWTGNAVVALRTTFWGPELELLGLRSTKAEESLTRSIQSTWKCKYIKQKVYRIPPYLSVLTVFQERTFWLPFSEHVKSTFHREGMMYHKDQNILGSLLCILGAQVTRSWSCLISPRELPCTRPPAVYGIEMLFPTNPLKRMILRKSAIKKFHSL